MTVTMGSASHCFTSAQLELFYECSVGRYSRRRLHLNVGALMVLERASVAAGATERMRWSSVMSLIPSASASATTDASYAVKPRAIHWQCHRVPARAM